jgi:hypothetical protein
MTLELSFTLAMLSAMSHVSSHLIYLPWPIETIPSVSCRPRWPRQVQSNVAVADGFANKHRQCKWSITIVMCLKHRPQVDESLLRLSN